MTKCPGKITQLCGAILYKCSKCGAVGYDKKGCSNQKFMVVDAYYVVN